MRFIVALINIFFLSISLGFSAICDKNLCIGVIDAGSTGTRLYIYSYSPNAQGNSSIKEVWSKKIQPGFASLELKKESVDAYFDRLLTDIPFNNISYYFYSTAGMRLHSRIRQGRYYRYLRDWFVEHPQHQLAEAKTITGNEEGKFAWLAVNYQLGTFSKKSAPVGVFDFGGASVQFVMPVKPQMGKNNNDLVHLTVNNKPYTIFVHSFLGLGIVEVSHQYLNQAQCFSTGYELPDGSFAQGDAYHCREEISKLVNNVHKVDMYIQPIVKDNPECSWYAIGGLVYLADTEVFNFAEGIFNMQDLLAISDQSLCKKKWSELQTQFPRDDNAYRNCLDAAAYYSLIHEGYGVPETKPIHLIKNSAADWTIGVVVNRNMVSMR
jgi:Golgi nucleoside diphosphatase